MLPLPSHGGMLYVVCNKQQTGLLMCLCLLFVVCCSGCCAFSWVCCCCGVVIIDWHWMEGVLVGSYIQITNNRVCVIMTSSTLPPLCLFFRVQFCSVIIILSQQRANTHTKNEEYIINHQSSINSSVIAD